MSIAGGVDRAVDRAVLAGCEALQVFTASANQWRGKELGDEVVARFRDKRAAAGALPVLSHDSYLINCASPDPALWERSVAALSEELGRCVRLGIELLVMHPGAHMGEGEEAGLDRVARALDRVLATPEAAGVTILLENTAGQGSTLGSSFAQLAALLARSSFASRLGVCFDTQHAFAAGYDLSSAEGWTRTWEEFDAALGPGRLRALHLNDSKRPLGARVDRHEHIGLGLLGPSAFLRVMRDPRFDGLPASLETEKTDDGGEDEQNLAVLRHLAGCEQAPDPATVARWRRDALRAARAARGRVARGERRR
jgi:deoxyribonuclease-4